MKAVMTRATLLASLFTVAACGETSSGTILVHDAWARETVAGVAVSAGYGRIENGTGSNVRLIGAEAPVAGRVEIHSVTHQGGVMRMRPVVGGLEIPAGGTVELRPGSYHLMLLDLRRPLRSGEVVPATLRFDRGEPIRVEFAVRSAADAAHGGGHE